MSFMANNTFKKNSLALLIASVFASGSTAYAADDSEKSEKDTDNVIIVTARKTAESIQEVPIAITAIDGELLIENGVSVLTEIQQYSPNTTLQNSRGTNSTLTAFIRGVGQEDPLWGYEPGVGIYIDDVYMARPQGAVLDLIDVERIEVLRGPQGTLYGKNTIGGAIKYITKKMSGEKEFSIDAAIGSYGRQDLKATTQIPVIDDKLYIGLAVASLTRDGFGSFLTSDLANQDRENYNKDVFSGRLAIEYTPSDKLFIKFVYDKTTDDSNSKGGFRLLPSLLTNAPVPDSVYDSYTSLPTWNKVELEGTSLTVEYEINEQWSFKSITSSRESYSPTNIDFDNTSLRIFDVPAFYDDEQFSQEFQVNYDTDDLSFVSGIFLFDSDSCGHFDAILEVLGTSIGFPGLTREVRGCVDGNSKAIYAQGSFDISEQLSMTLGARYTQEEKDSVVRNGLVFATIYPYSGWIPGYVRDDAAIDASVVEVLNDSKKWSRFTPRVGLEYQSSENTMWYASYAQGFKSGLFNPRASTPEPAADPEIVDSYEIGVRSDLSENFRLNTTLFFLDHQDRQFISVFEGVNPGDLDQRLGNIGKSESTGLEVESQYTVSDSLKFVFSLGLIDSKFSDALTFNGTGFDDISDRFAVINTPETTANIAFVYDFQNDLGDFSLNGNYYYRSEYDLSVLDNLLTQDGYGLANLSLNWFSDDGHWQAGLHAKNITDEEYLVGNYTFVTVDPATGGYLPGLGGDNTLIGYYGDPRTFALTVGYKF